MPYKDREKQLQYMRDYQRKTRKIFKYFRNAFDESFILTPQGPTTKVMLIAITPTDSFAKMLHISPLIWEDANTEVLASFLDTGWKELQQALTKELAKNFKQ